MRNFRLDDESGHQEALFSWAAYRTGLMPELQYMYHVPNGGKRDKATAAVLKRQGVKAGVPDIMLPAARAGYHGLYIELKAGENTTTKKQKEWLEYLRQQGYYTAVCYGWQPAAQLIEQYLLHSDELTKEQEELQGYTAVMDALKKAGSVRAASDAVLTGYEKPADQSETVKKKRAEYGEGYYKKYAAGNGTKYYRVRKSWTDAASQLGAFTSLKNAKSACKAGYTVYDDNGKAVYTAAGQQTSAGVPFSVQVDILDLNIRTGAGTNYAKTGETTGKGVFTIVEVKAGQGASAGWGRLKSGAGWISLDYATRLA